METLKKFTLPLLILAGIVLVVIVIGMIKFNVINDDIYITQPDGTVVRAIDMEAYTITTDDGSTGTFTYTSKEKDTAPLAFGDEFYQLRSVVSASGARYANEDETVVYWEHQGTATLEKDGELVATITSIVPAKEQEGVDTETPVIEESTEPTTPVTTLRPNLSRQALGAHAWEWKETQYNNDTVVAPTDPTRFVAQFSTDGTFSSTTDCNNTFGRYTLGKDSSLSFGPLAATLMACFDEQGNEVLEGKYGAMLAEVQSYMIADNGNLVLMLKYDSGSMIFVPSSKTTSE